MKAHDTFQSVIVLLRGITNNKILLPCPAFSAGQFFLDGYGGRAGRQLRLGCSHKTPDLVRRYAELLDEEDQ